MRKRWVPRAEPEKDLINKLRNEIQTTDILLKLIAQRNLTSFHEAHSYFVHDLQQLHSPFLMKDMDKAVARIHKAITQREKILVYGDYDVDGTTAVALVYSFFRRIHPRMDFYIPDRFKEGYGISFQGIDYAAETGATLIIALDCGIKSVAHVRYAKEKGIDFIICDHHLPDDELPEAAAILNPKCDGCEYPYKELSGCGIGYKLVTAYAEQHTDNWDTGDYLDLAAISIASDIVDMTGENRTMVHFGIQALNRSIRPGLKALMQLSSLKKVAHVSDLVFRIGPRINAAGRIASGKLAVEMLIEESEDKARQMARQIHDNNSDRQEMDSSITGEALNMIAQQQLHGRKTTVLYNEKWHKGVIGIVASRLIEHHYRPTILLTESNGVAVGSGRSVPGFNLYEALKGCEDLLTQWGGHHAAAGLSLPLENLEAFSEKFEECVSSSITEELLTPVVHYDTEIDLKEITPNFCKSIERFGPFGPGNMKPQFVSRRLRCAFPPKLAGKNHLMFMVLSESGIRIPAVAFNMGHLQHEIASTIFDICYTVEPDTFRDNYKVRLHIRDIQIHR